MKKQVLSTFITLSLSLALVSGTVLPAVAASAEKTFQAQSAETQPTVENGAVTPTSSDNANKQNYTGYKRWSRPVTSYLYENQSGGFTRVEYCRQLIESEGEGYEIFIRYMPDDFYGDGISEFIIDEYHTQKVIVEDYDSAFQIQSSREIEMELPIWGGFFEGNDYNFLVFGQKNENNNDNQEVIRVVKYSKDWKRIGSASLYGANTAIPFDAGSLRMTQYGNMLYIRTSHKMYNGHQANLTFSVRISDMTITDQFSEVMNIKYGYVSHSFNQFITTDGSTLLAADHGDAYPRSVSLIKYNKAAGNDTFTDIYGSCDYVEVFPIQGSTGNNDTGVAVGGLVVSDSSYLIAGNSVLQDNTYNALSSTRNIFVTSTPKNQFDKEHTEIHWITNYKDSDNVIISNPHMIKIDNQRILLLYTVNNRQINYTYLDGAGNRTSDIYTMEGMLSDCQPILYQGKVIWYYTNDSIPTFCSISLNSANGTKNTGWQLINNHWYYFDPASGAMKTNWQFINNKWYYFDSASGVMKTDWQFINNQWYYFDLTNGDMKTGWLKWNNQWYYLDLINGNCLTNTTTPDGYTVDENGVLIQ